MDQEASEPQAREEERLDDLDVSPEESEDVKGGTDAVVSPRDPASGLPTGKRMHKPFTVTAE
jgi:hypothetical protein